jgi:hypothetical protein
MNEAETRAELGIRTGAKQARLNAKNAKDRK